MRTQLLKDTDGPQLIGLTIAIASILLIAFSVVAADSGAGSLSSNWNGTTTVREQTQELGAETDIIVNINAYKGYPENRTVIVVLSPNQSYTGRETRIIRQFIVNGGTIVIAEDIGSNGNQLLQSIGVRTRFRNGILRDERFNHRSPAFPRVQTTKNGQLLETAEVMVLNYGTALRPNGATVLANTSSFAYLDTNFNERLDENESPSSYPVATVENIGQGKVIVIGDPSIFINVMQQVPENSHFTSDLLDGYENVVFDYSKDVQVSPLESTSLWIHNSFWAQLGIGTVIIFGIAIWVSWPAVKDSIRRKEY